MRHPPSTTSDPPRRLLFLTHPRSASHLFVRILNVSAQPAFSTTIKGEYYFFPAWMTQHEILKSFQRPISEWTEEERSELRSAYQKCADDFLGQTDVAVREGKVAFVKEHGCFILEPAAMAAAQASLAAGGSFTALVREDAWTTKVSERFGADQPHSNLHSYLNTTPLPDAVLKEWYPTFLIRHPALAFPSYLRVAQAPAEKMATQMTLAWTRSLYEFYDEHFEQVRAAGDEQAAHWPVVIDADDLITSPGVMKRWADITGTVDTSKLQYSWAPLSDEEKGKLHKIEAAMTKTLTGSAGVIAEGKTAQSLGLLGDNKKAALEREVKKWKEEFGEEDGTILKKWVKLALPDYEWLRERRVTI